MGEAVNGIWLAGLYALFGVLAAVANLGSQGMVHAVLPPNSPSDLAYWYALAVGTGVGLVVKYLLDKRYIFRDFSTGLAAHGRRFSLYSLMGVVTTLIFWGFQTVFFLMCGSDAMLYLGGAIGLAIGYWIKYRLDRRFVFSTPLTR